VPASSGQKPEITAIIVAAGMGRRMGSTVPKQFIPLAGIPLAVHSLQAFQDHAQVDRMVLVLPPQGDFPRLDLSGFSKLAATVQGGDSRQASVAHGLAAVDDSGWVLIHDAARPLVSQQVISSVLEAAQECGAAVPACPVGDTIKQVEGRTVCGTVAREGLVQVQTPQGFRTVLARQAHDAARRDDFVGTDDAQLVERLGSEVMWVEGSPVNFKVTTVDDLQLAAALLHSRRAGGKE
jgi:2-C-methyl-D-erythritol 4-phosphate cytidylyltransferase